MVCLVILMDIGISVRRYRGTLSAILGCLQHGFQYFGDEGRIFIISAFLSSGTTSLFGPPIDGNYNDFSRAGYCVPMSDHLCIWVSYIALHMWSEWAADRVSLPFLSQKRVLEILHSTDCSRSTIPSQFTIPL